MIKLIIFDVDNTLAAPNKSIPNNIVKALRKIEDKGIKIALISGKPVAYLSGLARQLGLQAPILSGENGATIYYSAEFPPQMDFCTISKKNKYLPALEKLHTNILKRFGGKVWAQPNLINLSVFPKNIRVKNELFRHVMQYVSSDKLLSKKFIIYKHTDAIEIVPVGVNKGNALRKIMAMEKLKSEEVVAVGDGVNDTPMFKEAGVSIGINITDTTYTVKNIERALKIIHKNILENNV